LLKFTNSFDARHLEMSSLENPSTKEKIVPTLSLLAFHPSKDYIVAGTPQGQFACWDLSAKEPFMGMYETTFNQNLLLRYLRLSPPP